MFAKNLGARSAQRAPIGVVASMRLLACSVAVVVMLLVGSASAHAESLCTDTWTGPAEGSWETASDWSAGVPTSSSVACLGSGTTVWTGFADAESIQDAGHLIVSNKLVLGGLISESSQIANLTIRSSDSLNTSGIVNVTHEFVGSGSVTGGGSLVLTTSATGSVVGMLGISDAKLLNEGVFTVGQKAGLQAGSHATLENLGTLVVNADNEGENHSLKAYSESTLVNAGTIKRTEAGGTTLIELPITNSGMIIDEVGTLSFSGGGAIEGAGGTWEADPGATLTFPRGTYNVGTGATFVGDIEFSGGKTSINDLHAEDASISVLKQGNGEGAARLKVSGSTPSAIGSLTMDIVGGTAWPPMLEGSGTVEITKSFFGGYAWAMEGTLLIRKGAAGQIGSATDNVQFGMTKEVLKNYGTLEINLNGGILNQKESQIINRSTLTVNGETGAENHGIVGDYSSQVDNYGTFQKTEGTGTTTVETRFFNHSKIRAYTGKFYFEYPMWTVSRVGRYGKRNKSALSALGANCGDPVNCLTGNFYESQTDIAAGGRGVGLGLTRTYNAQAAAAGEHGAFGYGWTSSFGEHLTFNTEAHTVTLVQEEGSTVTFAEEGGKLVAPEWTQDELTGSKEAGYTLTMSSQTVYKFSGSGLLESVTDRNGNATSVGYNEKGELATITDPAGRTIKLAYDAEGLMESATDPMGHVVKYAYESGNLVSVTMPGESSPRWSFKYDASHRITSMTNGLGGETENTYNSESQVTVQTEPSGTVMKWEYEPFVTKVTDEATGSVTLNEYTSEYQLAAITHGYGTEHATTESWTYNERGEPLTRTDGKGNVTGYEYDAAGDKTAETDPEGHEAKWSYNSHHQVVSETNPSGESTSIEYDEHGNAVKVSRPAPEEKTQVTRYEYNAAGEMTAMIDPLEDTWRYGYDEAGDRTSETSPEGDKTTWGYNEDGQQTSEVAAAGNVEGGKRVEYMTSTERDAQGLPVKVTQPEGQETLFEYNAEGAQTAVTDPNGHKTSTSYNSEDLPVKVTQASGATQETEYNGAGQVIARIDGNKHATKYVRNVLGQVTEIVNPLEQKTKETYDADGNLASLTDPMGRTTTYSYNKQDQPTKIAYSEEATPTVEYEYNADGRLVGIKDGTGTSSVSVNQLGEVTETKDGHGEKVGYAYNLAGQLTQITYPDGKTVKDGYDKAGRLTSASDWLGHTIGFSYTPSSQPETISFPEASGESDHYTYDRSGQISEAKMLKGSETLAQLAYQRDHAGQVSKETQTGLPGAETIEDGYTVDEQLEKAGSASYEYDPAGNPTSNAGAAGTFNAADELTKAASTTYTYNEDGQRTKATPETGPASTYGWNQAGALSSISRPEEGSTPKIEDTYTYNGNDLRASETINGTTSYLTWDTVESPALLLSNGTNSYIYGPEGEPVEEINSKEEATYLHHDQQGSTRLLTNEKGEAAGSYSYGPYGETSGHTGTATTALGYDGQYTSPDTGLIYLRARVYDPATAQFLSVDPFVATTWAPYYYASDSPVNASDPSGLCVDPTGFLCPVEHQLAQEVEAMVGGALGGMSGGLISVGNHCGNAQAFGELAALIPLPEDIGAEIFAKLAEKFPTLARVFVKQQANQSLTQPGKATAGKVVLEHLKHLLGG